VSEFLRAILKYDPSQERAPAGSPEGGQWIRTGNVVPGYSSKASLSPDGVIHTSDVSDAVKALTEGRAVQLEHVREVSTLLDKLAALAHEAEAKGDAAPVYDLCKVSVKGTNLFCAQALDIARSMMPQLRGTPLPGSTADGMPKERSGKVDATHAFLARMEAKGYTVTPTEEAAAYLRASQRELNGAKVGQVMAMLRERPLFDPRMVISEDNYIIDGHHRWAAMVGLDAGDGKLGDVKIPVIRVGIKIMDLLREANEFVDEVGLKRSGVQMTMRNAPWLTKVAKRDTDGTQPRDERGRWIDTGRDGGALVYHGSPYDFDRFDLGKIGRGEGVQMAGWGLYFAEAPGVARQYQQNVVNMDRVETINRRLSELVDIMDADSTGQYREFRSDVGRAAAAEYDKLINERTSTESNKFYVVDIPDSAAALMVDGDASLSQQPEHVRRAFTEMYEALPVWSRATSYTDSKGWARHYPGRDEPDGAGIYELLRSSLGGAEAASKALEARGIPGLRYFDQASREAGKGTRNFVIWDQSLLDVMSANILSKYDPDQPRGKTTPESNSGSFAHKTIPSGPQKITVESFEYKRPGIRYQNKVDVMFNPRDKQELLRWADEGASSLRWMQWGGNAVFWSSHEALHQQVVWSLSKLGYISSDEQKLLETALNYDSDAAKGMASSGDSVIRDFVHSTLYDDLFPAVKKSWLSVVKEWREEDHLRGKTTPESTPGSFTSAQQRSVARFEAGLAGLSYEDAQAFDVHGTSLILFPPKRKSRSEFRLSASDDIRLSQSLDAVLTHNHVDDEPHDFGASLSHTDVLQAIQYNLKAVRAVHRGVVYQMVRGPEGWPSMKEFRKAYMAYNAVIPATSPDFSHEVMRRAAEEFPENLTYTRHQTVKKSWLQVIKDAVGWDESKVERGKTTPASNSGSFTFKSLPPANPTLEGSGALIPQYDDRVKARMQSLTARSGLRSELEAADQKRLFNSLRADEKIAWLQRRHEEIKALHPGVPVYTPEGEALIHNEVLLREKMLDFEANINEREAPLQLSPEFEDLLARGAWNHSLQAMKEETSNLYVLTRLEHDGAALMGRIQEQLDTLDSNATDTGLPEVDTSRIEPASLAVLHENHQALEDGSATLEAQRYRAENAYGDDVLGSENPRAYWAIDRYIGSRYDEINDTFRADKKMPDRAEYEASRNYAKAYEAEMMLRVNNEAWRVKQDAVREWRELNDKGGVGLPDLSREEYASLIAHQDRAFTESVPKLRELFDAVVRETVYTEHVEKVTGMVPRDWEDAAEIQRMIASRPPTTEPLVVWRGVKTGASINLDGLTPGDEITTEGFTSMSADRRVAQNWGSKTLEVHVPAGSTGLLFTTNDGEDEVIANHGQRLEFVGRRMRVNSDGELEHYSVFTYLGSATFGKREGGRRYTVAFGRLEHEPELRVPAEESWLEAVLAKFDEASVNRGKTTPLSNSGSFAPKDDKQVDAFATTTEVGAAAWEGAYSSARARFDAVRNKGLKAFDGPLTELAKMRAFHTAQQILGGHETHTLVTAEMLRDGATGAIVSEYLVAEARDRLLQEEGMVEYAEVVRLNHAHGDHELAKENPEWADALDNYIGTAYDEINGVYRGTENREVDENDDTFKEYYGYYYDEREDEVREQAREAWDADNSLDERLEEDDQYKIAVIEQANGTLDTESYDEVVAEIRDRISSELNDEFESSVELDQALAGLREESEEYAREAAGQHYRERVREAEGYAESIKELIDTRPPTPTMIRVTRGLKSGRSIDFPNLTAGDVLELEGFTSASSKMEVAEKWGKKHIEIIVPAGSKDVLFTTNDGEGEVIFNHGSKITVLSRTDTRILAYYDPEGNGEDPEEVEKAEHRVIRVNFGRMQTEPKIIAPVKKTWLSAIKALVKWDESKHPRGKSTDKSTPGSFVAAEASPEAKSSLVDQFEAQMGQRFNDPSEVVPIYHGTASDVLPMIMKEGLRPGSETKVRRWNEQDFYSDPVRKTAVYVVNDVTKAVKWGKEALRSLGVDDAELVIIKAEVPRAVFERMQGDTMLYDGHLMHQGTIKPEWIKGYVRGSVDDAHIDLLGRASVDIEEFKAFVPRSAHVSKADTFTVYIPMVFAGLTVKKSWLSRVLKFDESQVVRGKTTPASNTGSFAPRNMGFVSPNIDENVDFNEAANRIQSHRTKLLMQADEEISDYFGTDTNETVGVGAWADGAEQSIIVDGRGDFEAFKAHMALSGLLADQKAVIAFTNDAKGPDSVYRLSVGNRPLREVHADLLEAGVQFHTLRKGDHGVDVFVFSQGSEQEVKDAVAKAAESFGVDEVATVRGYGEFIGSWDSREEGRAAYEAVLDGYESQVPGHDGGWKALRDRWLPRIQAVRKSWLQEVIRLGPFTP
jgi:hypothetical protein